MDAPSSSPSPSADGHAETAAGTPGITNEGGSRESTPGVEVTVSSSGTGTNSASTAEQSTSGDDSKHSPSGGSPMTLIWVAILAVIAFQFFFGSRNRRKQQAEADRLKSLAKGDRVLTIGRMHGTVVAFTDDTITLKPDDKGAVTMVFDRAALYRILPRPGEKSEEDAKK